MNKENVVYVLNRILFSPNKEGSPAVCNNMNEPRGHYAKRNTKPNRESQTLHDLTCMWNLKSKSQKQRVEW